MSICSNLIIKTLEWRHRHHWAYYTLSSTASIVDFEHLLVLSIYEEEDSNYTHNGSVHKCDMTFQSGLQKYRTVKISSTIKKTQEEGGNTQETVMLVHTSTAWKVSRYGAFFWSVFSRKHGPEKTPYFDTFHTVFIIRNITK